MYSYDESYIARDIVHKFAYKIIKKNHEYSFGGIQFIFG